MEKIPLKNGNTLIIEYDPDPMNPRTEYDNMGKMVCFHRRYILGDKNDHDPGDFSGWNSLKDHLIKSHNAFIIIPIYMIDHSGISIRASRDFSDCDPGQWDSGQIGFIYCTRSDVQREYGKKFKKITPEEIENARAYLMGEIEDYNRYLSGECYMYRVENPAGEILDSCGGFYGYDHLMSEFKDQVVPE
jgi:hypothetical protein